MIWIFYYHTTSTCFDTPRIGIYRTVLCVTGGERRRAGAHGETGDEGVRVRGSDTTHVPAAADGIPAATDNAVVPYTGEPATGHGQDRYTAEHKFTVPFLREKLRAEQSVILYALPETGSAVPACTSGPGTAGIHALNTDPD